MRLYALHALLPTESIGRRQTNSAARFATLLKKVVIIFLWIRHSLTTVSIHFLFIEYSKQLWLYSFSNVFVNLSFGYEVKWFVACYSRWTRANYMWKPINNNKQICTFDYSWLRSLSCRNQSINLQSKLGIWTSVMKELMSSIANSSVSLSVNKSSKQIEH